MTIASTATRKEYVGNGVTTAFPFPYQFQANTDLVVWERTIATGALVKKTYGTDYTVTGAGNSAGGTVTATTAPANTVNWIIVRDPARTQGVTLVNGAKIDVVSGITDPLDALTLMVQRQNDRNDRAIHAPDGDLAADADLELPAALSRKNMFLGFDGSGHLSLSSGIPDGVSVIGPFTKKLYASAYNTLADALTAAIGASAALAIDATLQATGDTSVSVPLVFEGNGKLDANGHTITLTEFYYAPLRQPAFDVSVVGSLVTAKNGQYASPEQFGWKPDGNDGAMAVASLNSFAGVNDFDSGTYVTSVTRVLDNKHHLIGKGWSSQIKVANGANLPAISTKNFSSFVANQDYGVFPEDFSIENICVNGNALTSVNDEGDAGNTTNDGIQIAATRYLLKNVYVFGAGGHGINSPVNNDSTNKPTSPYDRTIQNEAIWQNIHCARNGGNGINYGGPNDAWLDVIFTYTNLGKGLYVYNSSFANIGFIHSYSNHGRNCHIDTGASLRVTQGHYRDGLVENLVIDGSYFGSYILCNDAWISGSPEYSVIINGQTHIGIAEIQTNNGESGINITAGSTTIDIGKLECYVASGTAGAVGVNYASTAKVKIKGTIAGFADNLASNNGQGNMWELSLTTTSTSYGLKLSRDNSAQDGNFWKISYTGAYLIDPAGGATTFNERDYVEVLHVNGSGARSHNSILADQVCAVDSTGIKGPFTAAHGLVQAPNVGNISANFYKGGGTYARDWVGNILIESADATNITYYVNVGTASGTSGAKASVKFTAKIGGMFV